MLARSQHFDLKMNTYYDIVFKTLHLLVFFQKTYPKTANNGDIYGTQNTHILYFNEIDFIYCVVYLLTNNPRDLTPIIRFSLTAHRNEGLK